MKTRKKGYRSEHELEKLLKEAGIPAKRIPMSGQAIHRGDIRININNQDYIIGEIKAYQTNFFEYDLLKNSDIVFKRTIRKGMTKDFLVVMPLNRFISLLKKDGNIYE